MPARPGHRPETAAVVQQTSTVDQVDQFSRDTTANKTKARPALHGHSGLFSQTSWLLFARRLNKSYDLVRRLWVVIIRRRKGTRLYRHFHPVNLKYGVVAYIPESGLHIVRFKSCFAIAYIGY